MLSTRSALPYHAFPQAASYILYYQYRYIPQIFDETADRLSFDTAVENALPAPAVLSHRASASSL